MGQDQRRIEVAFDGLEAILDMAPWKGKYPSRNPSTSVSIL